MQKLLTPSQLPKIKGSKIDMSQTTETVLEIDLDALHSNYRYLRSKINPETKFVAVIKAFGYGSDSTIIANALTPLVDYFAVAYTYEGEDLRKNNITKPTMVFHALPVDFESLVAEISQGVYYFDTKEISSEDVTEQYIDIEARLKAKKELENRYLEILQKAQKVSEILEIERELSKIREEIESRQGQLNYLQSKVSMSRLHISFYKETANTGVTASYGSKMWNALKGGFNGMSSFFLGLLYIWPFIAISVIAFYIIRKKIRKRKK